MDYTDFLEKVQREMEDRLGEGTTVRLTKIWRNNGSRLVGMTILREGENAAPAIYMEEYYGQYLRGVPLEKIAERILACAKSQWKTGCMNTDFFTDFQQAAAHIFCRVINYEKNEKLLLELPFRRYLDLAVVYYYRMEQEPFEKASILIKKEHLSIWEITPEELDEMAVENTMRILPSEVTDISTLIYEMTGMKVVSEEPVCLHVLTNSDRNYGAVGMIFDRALEKISEKTRGDFYLLPSSVHECMILPPDVPMTVPQLRQMVSEINAEHVADEEVLGDSVYYYDAQKKQLSLL